MGSIPYPPGANIIKDKYPGSTACVVKRSEGIGTPIPTGATINEVDKDCMDYFPWWGWVLIFGIPALLCFGCFWVKVGCFDVRKMKRAELERITVVTTMEAAQVHQVKYPN